MWHRWWRPLSKAYILVWDSFPLGIVFHGEKTFVIPWVANNFVVVTFVIIRCFRRDDAFSFISEAPVKFNHILVAGGFFDIRVDRDVASVAVDMQ